MRVTSEWARLGELSVTFGMSDWAGTSGFAARTHRLLPTPHSPSAVSRTRSVRLGSRSELVTCDPRYECSVRWVADEWVDCDWNMRLRIVTVTVANIVIDVHALVPEGSPFFMSYGVHMG